MTELARQTTLEVIRCLCYRLDFCLFLSVFPTKDTTEENRTRVGVLDVDGSGFIDAYQWTVGVGEVSYRIQKFKYMSTPFDVMSHSGCVFGCWCALFCRSRVCS